ncbi:hypothetical protein AB28_3292 [Raoultella ornithinolytica 2-156-04_S1_C2]|nr:hypothetical protein AB28_3292 [Raoultella ornithinolytica 2-156-04_S1_C2]
MVICNCLSSGVYAVTQKMNSSMVCKIKKQFQISHFSKKLKPG